MSKSWHKNFMTVETPQSQPIPNAKTPQIPNSAGGFAWGVDDLTRLNRFLILGAEGGSYYASEKKLVKENAEATLRAIQNDGLNAVLNIVRISVEGRAPKNDYAIFALAMAAKLGNDETRKAAVAAVPKVCRIPTHLMMYAEFVKGFGGWGRSTRRAIASWYEGKKAQQLAFQMTKYGARGGKGQRWSHRDMLLKSHFKPQQQDVQDVLKYIVKGELSEAALSHEAGKYLYAVEQVKKVDTTEMLGLISEYKLPMEVIPTEKRDADVYRLMLMNYGITALLRNLGNLSAKGVLVVNDFEVISHVCERLTNQEALVKGRVHPLSILVAMETYKSGQGLKGSSTWKPVPDVVDALDEAFYKAFKAVEPTGKVRLLAIDVSGSMSWSSIAGMPITPRVGAGAMSMITYRAENKVIPMAFSHKLVPVDLTRKKSLADVLTTFQRISMGGTDCALPIKWALDNKVGNVDSFEVYTDSETWYGSIHPVQALKQYRNKYNPEAKLIVVGMVSNGFSIAEPDDPGMLDVVGFDTAAPQIMSQFVAGKL